MSEPSGFDKFRDNTLGKFLEGLREEPAKGGKDFKTCARYYRPMDMILFLEEDVSYVAQQTDSPWFELLMHPYDTDRIVGLKIHAPRMLAKKLLSGKLKIQERD